MFDEMNDKQLLDRMKFLIEKLENLHDSIQPLMVEFNKLKEEIEQISGELDNREDSESEGKYGIGT